MLGDGLRALPHLGFPPLADVREDVVELINLLHRPARQGVHRHQHKVPHAWG